MMSDSVFLVRLASCGWVVLCGVETIRNRSVVAGIIVISVGLMLGLLCVWASTRKKAAE